MLVGLTSQPVAQLLDGIGLTIHRPIAGVNQHIPQGERCGVVGSLWRFGGGDAAMLAVCVRNAHQTDVPRQASVPLNPLFVVVGVNKAAAGRRADTNGLSAAHGWATRERRSVQEQGCCCERNQPQLSHAPRGGSLPHIKCELGSDRDLAAGVASIPASCVLDASQNRMASGVCAAAAEPHHLLHLRRRRCRCWACARALHLPPCLAWCAFSHPPSATSAAMDVHQDDWRI
mmetsp:Transcript_41990/g.119183  ORF Transcript_41990/g.119183 Transcript_41990/m.119183 type:complete len:231 (+) Transcript_41990:2778-3470(+)